MRIYVYLAVALAFLGLLAREHMQTQKLKAAVAREAQQKHRAEQAESQVLAEQKARQHEQTIAKAASDGYQAELTRIRATPDLGPVRLCKRSSVPQADSAARAATGSHAEAARHVESADEVDIGPAVNEFVEDCEANAAQLTSLQEWVRAR